MAQADSAAGEGSAKHDGPKNDSGLHAEVSPSPSPPEVEEILEPVFDEPAEEDDPASVLAAITREESPVVARVRARHHGEAPVYHARRDEPPLWLWIVIGAGTLLALILLVVFLVTRL